MKVKKKNFYSNYLGSIILLLSMFIHQSCNNNSKSQDSKNDMKGMDGKNEIRSESDSMSRNMKGKDMGDLEMKNQNESNKKIVGFSDSMKIVSLVMPANYRVVSSQKSIKPIQQTSAKSIRAQGYISIDERFNSKVSSRVSGRIEKLYVKYNLQYVKKGEKVMKIYSPELNTYQEELLFLMKDINDLNLMNKAEEKLRLLGISQAQINKIKKTGHTLITIDINSPVNGYVFFSPNSTAESGSLKNMSDNATNNKMGGVANNGNSSKSAISENAQIREGNYVNKGDVLFWINNLDEVWAMLAVDNNHQHELKSGAAVSLISELYKKDTIHATINFIEPVYQQNKKFIITRIYLKNTDKKYKINSLIEAQISTFKSASYLIPYSSILFLGKRKIVWVLKEKTAYNNKIYEARDVILGVTQNEWVEIKSGLNRNESIAVNAGFLLDRESLIKPN
ncbi:MAG: efflux RND transporter periplasmic adaptor subunit [Bacteroidia bacterium]|nr:efflux RND transporter periplasmic adaptor subunit [Bacteroidia bacterium]